MINPIYKMKKDQIIDVLKLVHLKNRRLKRQILKIRKH
jgi:hypothetical protein